MKRPHPNNPKPVKLVTFADLIEAGSIECAVRKFDHVNGQAIPGRNEDRVFDLMCGMMEVEKQAKALIATVPAFARKHTLEANVAMLRMRTEIRMLVHGVAVCKWCRRLFVPEHPSHKSCEDCHMAWLLKQEIDTPGYDKDYEEDAPPSGDPDGGYEE